MDNGLIHTKGFTGFTCDIEVLILIVVDNGLIRSMYRHGTLYCLNPCCNGRWSRTEVAEIAVNDNGEVLILVVMEDGLVHP